LSSSAQADDPVDAGASILVTTGHSRSKNGVASLASDPVVHADAPRATTSINDL
jgi:hypothetical protein